MDASALIELLTRSDRGRRVEERALRPSSSVHAPALIDVEVAQVLRRYVLSGQVPEHWARSALDVALAFPMTRYWHQPLLKRVWELKENVTAYDATYVALAEGLNAPLLTCDARLSRIAGSTAAIELIS
jgi:predicted nucleic acid-binding protein